MCENGDLCNSGTSSVVHDNVVLVSVFKPQDYTVLIGKVFSSEFGHGILHAVQVPCFLVPSSAGINIIIRCQKLSHKKQ